MEVAFSPLEFEREVIAVPHRRFCLWFTFIICVVFIASLSAAAYGIESLHPVRHTATATGHNTRDMLCVEAIDKHLTVVLCRIYTYLFERGKVT